MAEDTRPVSPEAIKFEFGLPFQGEQIGGTLISDWAYGRAPEEITPEVREVFENAGYDADHAFATGAPVNLDPETQEPHPVTETSLMYSPEWIAASKVMRGLVHLPPSIPDVRAPRPSAHPFTRAGIEEMKTEAEIPKELLDTAEMTALADQLRMSPKEIIETAQWGLEFMGWFNYNIPAMALNTQRIRGASAEQKLAMYHLMKTYDEKKIDWNGTKRAFKGVISDPSSYVGLATLGIGTVAGVAVKQSTKNAIRAALRRSLGPIVVGGVEGGVYGSVDDAMRQIVAIAAGKQEGGFDLGRNLQTAGITATAASTLVGSLAATPAVVKKVGGWVGDTAAAARRGQLNMGVGSGGGMTKAINTPGPVYQSRLTEALEAMPQEKMSTDQVRGYLAKRPGGISADELQHTGVADMLNAPGKVTKTDLLNQVRANPLEIKDVVKGAGRDTVKPSPTASAPYLDEWGELSGKIDAERAKLDQARLDMSPEYAGIMERVNKLENRRNDLHRQMVDDTIAEQGGPSGPTQFSDPNVNLPGGEDYKEMLLTLPAKPRKMTVREAMAEQGISDRHIREGHADEIVEHVGGFTGGHYDEPNVLAHARYDTRTVDGDKTLFIQEIQSDWHQAGRKGGYRSEGGMSAEEVQELTELRTQDAMFTRETTGTPLTEVQHDRMLQLEDLADPTRPGGTVPDAPFKKNWHELTLKRMIREAAETGHDRIAWTPGEVQVTRYQESLRKAVDEIHWEKTPDGVHLKGYKGAGGRVEMLQNRMFLARTEGGMERAFPTLDEAEKYLLERKQSIVDTTEQETALSDAIGKAMGDDIIESSAQSGVIRGDDLRIDATGMAGFYDKMMVKAANKYAKKYGAKVEVKKASLDRSWPTKYHIMRGDESHAIFDTQAEATAALNDRAQGFGGGQYRVHASPEIPAKEQDIWTLKITPEMKRAILTEGVRASVDRSRFGGGILANALDNVTRQRGMTA